MKAYFINGKTSKRRECDITFSLENVSISYIDDTSNVTVSEWKISDIHKINVRTTHKALKYGEFPHEVLEFKYEEDFNAIIHQYSDAEFHKSSYNKFTTLGWKGIASAMAGVVFVSLLFFFYGAPFLADTFARNIPNDYETYIGGNFQKTYLQYLTVDSAKSDQIQRFYDHLEFESEYDISVVVVESNMVNAFALPGGYIVVYSGIMEIIANENELAGLLAHETSHINGRHSLRIISKDLAMYLLLASLTGDMGGFSSVLIENSNMISSLSFSRKFEKDADMDGLDLMVQSDLDPTGMVELFKKFEDGSDSIQEKIANKLTKDSSLVDTPVDSTSEWHELPMGKVAELLSTHPAPKNRIKYLMKEISKIENSIHFAVNDSLSYYFKELKTN